MIVRSFEKSGISLAIDGSQDYLINITGLDEYEPGEDKGKRLDDRYPVLTEPNRANCEADELEVEELSENQWNTWRNGDGMNSDDAPDTEDDD